MAPLILNIKEMKTFLNVVVTECASIFQLFSGKDQTLLVRWNTYNSYILCTYIFCTIGTTQDSQQLVMYSENAKFPPTIHVFWD